MGILPLWRSGDLATIRDMAQGIDFYYSVYSDVALTAQPTYEPRFPET